MVITQYKATKEMVNCRICPAHKNGKCFSPTCLWMDERIDAGLVKYDELVMSFYKDKSIAGPLISAFNGDIYLDESHEEFMLNTLNEYEDCYFPGINKQLAALYVINSDAVLTVYMKNSIGFRNISFKWINSRDLNRHQQRLIALAQEIYTSESFRDVLRMQTPLDDDEKYLKYNAAMIMKYGINVFFIDE